MSLKYVNKKVGMKYSREDIDKIGAQYNIILSGRNAGKSYSIAAGTRPHEGRRDHRRGSGADA